MLTKYPCLIYKKEELSLVICYNTRLATVAKENMKEGLSYPFDMDGYVNYFIARSFSNHWMWYKNPNASRDIIFNELNIDWD